MPKILSIVKISSVWPVFFYPMPADRSYLVSSSLAAFIQGSSSRRIIFSEDSSTLFLSMRMRATVEVAHAELEDWISGLDMLNKIAARSTGPEI